jgi:hypothetical protein
VLDQQPDLAVEASDGVNISLGCRHGGRVYRVWPGTVE